MTSPCSPVDCRKCCLEVSPATFQAIFERHGGAGTSASASAYCSDLHVVSPRFHRERETGWAESVRRGSISRARGGVVERNLPPAPGIEPAGMDVRSTEALAPAADDYFGNDALGRHGGHQQRRNCHGSAAYFSHRVDNGGSFLASSSKIPPNGCARPPRLPIVTQPSTPPRFGRAIVR
jgi:hypothetical protein